MMLLDAIKLTYDVHWKFKPSGNYMASKLESLGLNVPINQLNTSWFSWLKQHLSAKGLKPSTINGYLSGFRTVLTVLEEHEIEVPKPKIRYFHPKNERLAVWTEELVQKASEALRNSKVEHYRITADLLVVLFDTGLRLGEALAIKQNHINGLTLLVPRQKGTQNRTIPLTQRVHAILTKHHLPFPLKQSQVHSAMRFLHNKQIVPKHLVIHSLRHSYASRLVTAGVSLFIVQHALGHASPKTTLRYAHLQPEANEHILKALS